MASKIMEDSDLVTRDVSEDSNELTQNKRQFKENLELQKYVKSMAFKQNAKRNQHTESLSKNRKTKNFNVPSQKDDRSKYNEITAAQLEQEIRSSRTEKRRKEDILKRKEEIYDELLTKLEQQCRTQYLYHVLKKFTNFIVKLSTAMPVPSQLFDPYDRIQRTIFCKILQSAGIAYASQADSFYNTIEGSSFTAYHKLSHALLSIIIKAIRLASTHHPDKESVQLDTDCKLDDAIKLRLMRAAERKVLNSK